MLIQFSRKSVWAVKRFLAVIEEHSNGEQHLISFEVDFDVCSLYILLNF